MTGSGGFAKSLGVGALLGLLAVVVAVVAVLAGSGRSGWFKETEPPSQVLVVAVTNDADGATVAGIVVLVSSSGEFELIDPFMEAEIPGTSYSALRDASSFGGGQAVADAYAGATGAAESPAWVVLPREVWQKLVDDAGGAAVTVPASVNVFLDDELYVIEGGEQTLSGAELAALVATEDPAQPDSTRAVNASVVQALGTVVAGSWDAVAAAVEAGDASSSVEGELLGQFASGFAAE